MATRSCKQCAAETDEEQRCKNRTCKYSKFCWIHTRKLTGFTLGKSGIPNSGTGLFAWKDIPAGKVLLEYKGERITKKAYDERDSGYGVGYKTRTGRDMVVDARDTQSGLGRYANDCRPANVAAGHCPGYNAQFFEWRSPAGRLDVYIEAIKDIKKGEEIFLNYGDNFF